ncbi:MAG: hypothetical protein C4311_05585 [Chloroflexota bacterium]
MGGGQFGGAFSDGTEYLAQIKLPGDGQRGVMHRVQVAHLIARLPMQLRLLRLHFGDIAAYARGREVQDSRIAQRHDRWREALYGDGDRLEQHPGHSHDGQAPRQAEAGGGSADDEIHNGVGRAVQVATEVVDACGRQHIAQAEDDPDPHLLPRSRSVGARRCTAQEGEGIQAEMGEGQQEDGHHRDRPDQQRTDSRIAHHQPLKQNEDTLHRAGNALKKTRQAFQHLAPQYRAFSPVRFLSCDI